MRFSFIRVAVGLALLVIAIGAAPAPVMVGKVIVR